MWITRVSISNPVFAAMVMAALCVLGLFSLSRLGVEQLPDIASPIVFVQTQYRGASPDAVEREISRPIEETINGVSGIKRITSRSTEGSSSITVEFTLDVNIDRALQDLRDRVASIQGVLPRDVRPPTIIRAGGSNAAPVVSMAILSDTRTLRELSVMAELTVARRLQRLDGVARVDVSGLARREIRVDLDPQRLRGYRITPAEVAQALRESNADQPVGLVTGQNEDAQIRLEGRIRDPAAFASVVVAQRNGLALTLADLGRVYQRDREPDSHSRMNGKPAITLNLYKQQDANVVAVGDRIKEGIEELRRILPKDVDVELVYASSDWTRQSLDGLKQTLREGALLTVLIVFLFLHSWRSTVITGLTLPIAVLSTFIAMHAFGFTLNFMTMMALSLSIGLLVDDAIVVRENIVRHVGMGKDHRTAARDGTEEIGLAVMATTFAICAVFVPVGFMGGAAGKFFYPFGITVTVAVLVSLLVSFTLDPMLSSVWHDPHDGRVLRVPVVGHAIRATEWMMARLTGGYERLAVWIFSGRRWRLPWPTWGRPFGANGLRSDAPRRLRRATLTPRGVVMAVGLLAFLGALVMGSRVGTEFVPRSDQGFTSLNLRAPVGSNLDRTDQKVRQAEAIVLAFPEVRAVATSVGGIGRRNQATIAIALKDRRERSVSQAEFEAKLRDAIATVPGLEAVIGFTRPIEVAILGSDVETLRRLIREFTEKASRIPGLVDPELSIKPGIPAFAVRLKPDAVRELGLSNTLVAANLRAFVNGDPATLWTSPDGEQVEVLLRLNEQDRQQAGQLLTLPVAFSAQGTPIPLQAVARLEPVFNEEVINRQNLQRRESMTAGVDGRPAGDVGADIRRLMEETTLPPGYAFDVTGQLKDQQDTFAGFAGAMGLAVIFIYMVLASQFGSFVQPLAIMASLPLALIGVMIALLMWGSTFNIFSLIGLIMLMGLVTKNAILLVDHANHLRRAEGADVPTALREAGLTRMRPIMMTTFAMVFGMLPLALALSEGSEIQAPMGRAIIGGVLTSTLLTLVVVPVIYSYLVRDPRPAKLD